jgi:hypothetical protein
MADLSLFVGKKVLLSPTHLKIYCWRINNKFHFSGCSAARSRHAERDEDPRKT